MILILLLVDGAIFTFGCCILLRIYPTWFPMMPSIATKFKTVLVGIVVVKINFSEQEEIKRES
jgi:hypothetical protein